VIEILKRYKKSVTTFLIFVAYSVVMLWSYYDAQVRLDEDVVNEIRLETEKQAAAISYFFTERRNDLVDLAASQEVSNFFVNRDLGMSYAYGLGLSVQAVEARFERMRAQKLLGSTSIYHGIALVDGEGRLIASGREGVPGSIREEILRGADRVTATVSSGVDQRNIHFAAPVVVNNRYRGHVVAWSTTDVFSALVAENGHRRLAARVVTDAVFPRGDALATVDSDGGDGKPVSVVRAAIGNAPFSLITPISGKLAGEHSMSRLFLITAGLVPLLVLFMALRDIYERKQFEELQQAARLEAERLARLRGEFVANMSHEIRTPLNGVLGLAQIGYRKNIGRQEVLDTFARILDSGKLLLGIVNDVLDFSKIEAGKLAIEKAPVDIGRLIEEVRWMHSERAAAKGIELRIEKADSLPATCLGDSIRLAQILNNLLSNAVKFTEKGLVILRAGLEDGQLRFRVADSGIGMSQEEMARLFTPFEQADSSTTRRFGGTGLGLAITKRLIELMAGTIRVESVPGSGTTFDVSLPYAPVPANMKLARALPALAADGPRLCGICVLVAEDNEVNRLILDEMLASEGAHVALVENGKQAVDLVAREGGEAWDLVLMDIQMPVMDGYEATTELLKLAPGLPVVAQTAHALSGEMDRCRAVGMVDQLTKPVDCEKLVDIVLRNARGAPTPQPATGKLAPAAAMVGAPIVAKWMDWAALRERYALKPEFLNKLLTAIVSSLATMPTDLREALRAEDVARTIYLAHSLKGAAGNLMASELAKKASEAEQACRVRAEDADALIAGLADAVENLLKEVGEELGRDSQVSAGRAAGRHLARELARRA
jgi:signal transduction histidine kinase/CheY-like chemotaxis protein